MFIHDFVMIYSGYVVAMHSLNGEWHDSTSTSISSEECSAEYAGNSENAENVPLGVEALNMICMSTPSLDSSKYTFYEIGFCIFN